MLLLILLLFSIRVYAQDTHAVPSTAIYLLNANPTGTTLNKLAQISSGKALIVGTTDDPDFLGVVMGGAGTTGTAQIIVAGRAKCTFDAGTTVDHYIQKSATITGDCTDAGASRPTTGAVVGKVLSTHASGGTYDIFVFSPGQNNTLNVNNIRVCNIRVGEDNSSSVLVNADLGPQANFCYLPFQSNGVIEEIMVTADGGTPSVMVAINHLGSNTNLLTSELATAASGGRACSKTSATVAFDNSTTCIATLQNTTFLSGDYISLVSGTTGAVAKRMTISISLLPN